MVDTSAGCEKSPKRCVRLGLCISAVPVANWELLGYCEDCVFMRETVIFWWRGSMYHPLTVFPCLILCLKLPGTALPGPKLLGVAESQSQLWNNRELGQLRCRSHICTNSSLLAVHSA